jgi:hypothetical protein
LQQFFYRGDEFARHLDHLAIRETRHSEPLGLKRAIAAAIPGERICVVVELTPVEFDRNYALDNKIDAADACYSNL